MIDLSILICSTHTRYRTFGPKIQDQVWSQYHALSDEDQSRIEIMILTDNKKIMLGEKRNIMVDAAQGRYVQFIDDDDRIAPDMFKTVLDACKSDTDVITFKASVSLNGQSPKVCDYSCKHRCDYNTATGYFRIPNHICAVKREIAQKSSFPNVIYGEDSGYSKLLLPFLKSEAHIDKVLYFYDYSDATTETQTHHPAAKRIRRQKDSIVDVVILSNAKDLKLQNMTQHAIDTCIAGANSLPINVIVVEQKPGVVYTSAQTLLKQDEFNYAAFANFGASVGHAGWVMIANNDLVFTDGWLHALIAANHPVVSPKEPNDVRQTDIIENTTGSRVGKHLSGWCNMIRRDIWDEIGGLDEEFPFWCVDDALVEQLREIDIEPMLVVDSIVKHLGSITLNSETRTRYSNLTWAGIDRFNQKYGTHRLAGHPNFKQWKAAQGRL